MYTTCDGVYYACSPDFNKFEDGSIDYHVTYGDTIDEAVNNVSEVIVLEINDYVNENIEIPRLSIFDELQEKVGENQIISFVRFNITGKKSPTSAGGAMNCPIVSDIIKSVDI